MLFPVPVEIVWIAPSKEEREQKIVAKLQALNTGMTEDELIKLVQFIEPLRQSKEYKKYYYLRKEDTKLARTIEFDPKKDKIFIHLKSHNIPSLGKGYHKRVSYSILYHPEHPQLVACAVVSDSNTTRAELAVLERFRGSEGIIQTLYVSKHKKKSGKTLYEIVTPLYNLGSLNAFLKKNSENLPLSVKRKIAQDILIGSCRLNSKGYVNADNNKGNFFVHHENGVYTTVIGDVGGHTQEAHVVINKRALGPFFHSSPPDLIRAYYNSTLQPQDLYSNHTYALGRAFYFLLFEKEVPWIEGFNKRYPLIANLYKDKSKPEVELELAQLTSELQAFSGPRLQELAQKSETNTITPQERFEFIVLQMLSTDPAVRKTNDHWLAQIQDLKLE